MPLLAIPSYREKFAHTSDCASSIMHIPPQGDTISLNFAWDGKWTATNAY